MFTLQLTSSKLMLLVRICYHQSVDRQRLSVTHSHDRILRMAIPGQRHTILAVLATTETYIFRQLTYMVLAKVDILFSPSYTLDFCPPPFRMIWT